MNMIEQRTESIVHGASGLEPHSSPPLDDVEQKPQAERGITIYGIRVGGSERYVYVGATTNLKSRRNAGYTADAIGAALNGVEWDMFPLEQCTLSEQVAREAHWIEKLRSEGHMLANAVSPAQIRALPVAPSRSGTTWGDDEYAAAGYGRLGLRLPAGDLEKLDVLAKEQGVTRSGLLAQWIRKAWDSSK